MVSAVVAGFLGAQPDLAKMRQEKEIENRKLALQEGTLKLQTRKQQIETQKAILDELKADTDKVVKLVSDQAAAGVPVDQSLTKKYLGQAVEYARMQAKAQGIDLPVTDMRATLSDSLAELTAAMTPDPSTRGRAEGRAAGESETAKAATGVQPAEKGAAEGTAKVASAQAVARGLTGSGDPKINEAVVERVLGLTADGKSEFERLMPRLLVHAQSGTLGTPEGQLLRERVQSIINANQPTDKPPLNIQFGEDGRVNIQQTPASKPGISLGGGAQAPAAPAPGVKPAAGGTRTVSPASLLTGNELNQNIKEKDRLDSAIKLIEGTIAETDRNPTAFGAVGSVRGVVQGVGGLTADLGSLFESATGVKVNKYASDIVDSAAQQFGAKEGAALAKLFDPQLSVNELVETSIAFALAQTRMNAGEGDERGIAAAVKQAKKELNLTGLTSTSDVRERLKKSLDVIADARKKLGTRLTGQEETPAGVPPGAKQIGTLQGKPVYELNGKRFVAD